MTPIEEYADRHVKQKWFDLVSAEQRGVPAQELEQLYRAYLLAVEEYNRCTTAAQPAPQATTFPVSERFPITRPASTSGGKRRKKAS